MMISDNKSVVVLLVLILYLCMEMNARVGFLIARQNERNSGDDDVRGGVCVLMRRPSHKPHITHYSRAAAAASRVANHEKLSDRIVESVK